MSLSWSLFEVSAYEYCQLVSSQVLLYPGMSVEAMAVRYETGANWPQNTPLQRCDESTEVAQAGPFLATDAVSMHYRCHL